MGTSYSVQTNPCTQSIVNFRAYYYSNKALKHALWVAITCGGILSQVKALKDVTNYFQRDVHASVYLQSTRRALAGAIFVTSVELAEILVPGVGEPEHYAKMRRLVSQLREARRCWRLRSSRHIPALADCTASSLREAYVCACYSCTQYTEYRTVWVPILEHKHIAHSVITGSCSRKRHALRRRLLVLRWLWRYTMYQFVLLTLLYIGTYAK